MQFFNNASTQSEFLIQEDLSVPQLIIEIWQKNFACDKKMK